MNLLFFDIECASVYKTTAKICAFGYVLCDEKFNIIKKEDILINPKGKFHLTDGRGEHGLVLPYEYSEFKKYPVFPQVYGRIRDLLEDKNNLVFGHATINDVNYLDLETRRFRLPPFNFYFSDSQLMYMTAVNDFSRQFGLEYITKDLQVEFTPHRAADDAYATMRVTEALCRKYECAGTEIDGILGIKRGLLRGHKIIRPNAKAYGEYREKCRLEKAERAKRRNKFYCRVNRKHTAKSDKLAGVAFNFSRRLEYDIEVSIPLVDKIFALGGTYAQKLSLCNVYVCEESDDTVRTRTAQENGGLKVLSVDELRAILDD
ncbi:MAG: exonuclease domain-containing protein [Roseburia sp.]|nr:exonuclease domain-containing protein [Roseburia sp.]